MDKLLGFIGRVIFTVPFLGFGFEHLTHANQLAGLVPSFFPGGVVWVYFTGFAMILAALAVITGKQGRNACFGLAVMLLVFIVFVHLPGLGNPATKVASLMGLLKDSGLMGASLAIAATFKK